MKILAIFLLMLVAFACGASWAELRYERILRKLEFQNRMLKLDIKSLEETLQQLRRKENGNT